MREPNTHFVKDDDRLILKKTTAEMLAMPFAWCPHRACRRDRCCDRADIVTDEPVCVDYLPPDMRETFDTFFILVLRIADRLEPPYPSADPETRALEEAAIEIITTLRLRRPKFLPGWETWLEKYRHNRPEDAEHDPLWRAVNGLPKLAPGHDHARRVPPAGDTPDDDIAFADAEDPRLDWRTYR